MAIEDMIRYHDAGFTSWDLADIYGPAEDFIGDYRHKLSTLKGTQEELNNVQALAKWVPQARIITRYIVDESIQRSLRRMGVSSLDFNSTGGIITIRITWMLSNTYLICGMGFRYANSIKPGSIFNYRS